MTNNAELIKEARGMAVRRFFYKTTDEREVLILKMADALEAAEAERDVLNEVITGALREVLATDLETTEPLQDDLASRLMPYLSADPSKATS